MFDMERRSRNMLIIIIIIIIINGASKIPEQLRAAPAFLQPTWF